MSQALLDLCRQRWKEFEGTPVDKKDNITENFLHFEVGTSRSDITRWFEETFGINTESLTLK